MNNLRPNPHKGIDGDDRDEISAMEALEYYVWKHPHGEELETLRKEFFEKDINTLLRLGYIKSNLGIHYNITEKGKRMFDLMFKPRTWTERLTDWFYAKVIKFNTAIT